MARPALLVFSEKNLLHNVATLKELVAPAKMIAMVKANAYGHGLQDVGHRLDGHVDLLGVASIDEALLLKKEGVQSDILLAQGVYEPAELAIAAENRFHVVFHHQTQIDWLEALILPTPLHCWFKLNTGFNRLGFHVLEETTKLAYAQLCNHTNIAQPVPILSHFSTADAPDHPLSKEQILRFQQSVNGLSTTLSLCNSAAIFHFPDLHLDYVRPGLVLYGASPIAGKTGKDLGLKPVMSATSKLMSVHKIPKGSFIGYGARYACTEDTLVGIVAFGYGDGYPLNAKDGTPVLVNGQQVPLIGRISMDMLAVNLTHCSDAKIGDPVQLWGEDLPVEHVAQWADTSPYCLLTQVTARVTRTWKDQSVSLNPVEPLNIAAENFLLIDR